LWETNGSGAGPRLVADAVPGPDSSSPTMITPSERGVFFAGGTWQTDLWFSDGMEGGTTKLSEFTVPIRQLVNAGKYVMFTLDYSYAPFELWTSDGTAAGTKRVTTLAVKMRMTAVGSSVYFGGYDPKTGAGLWKSDGTAAGTTLVKDFEPGTTGLALYGHSATVGETVFFVVNRTLWRSDGTDAGTMQVLGAPPPARSTRTSQ
jgi:ELWxxDGT repeat protein